MHVIQRLLIETDKTWYTVLILVSLRQMEEPKLGNFGTESVSSYR